MYLYVFIFHEGQRSGQFRNRTHDVFSIAYIAVAYLSMFQHISWLYFTLFHYITNFRFFPRRPFHDSTKASGAFFCTARHHPSAGSYCPEPLCLQRVRLVLFLKENLNNV